MRHLFIISIFVFGMGCATQAQQISTPIQEKISINMSAAEAVEADIIQFNININAEGATPETAFDIHKTRESLLADLLKEFEIEDKNIQYQPIRISKRYSNDRKSQFSITNQQVSLSFSDFNIYERIQLTLIENGFDSFSGSFSSTKIEEGKETALIAAINSAKEKAQLIASATGVDLGNVLNISYSDYMITPSTSLLQERNMMMDTSSGMMDFSQTVRVTANITIEYAIIN